MISHPPSSGPSHDGASGEPLSVTISYPDAATVLVAPAGVADAGAAPTLRQALSEAAEAGCPCVMVDLDQLTFLDATALNLLVDARRRAATTGAELRVRCHTELGLLMLKTVGLDTMLEKDA